MSNSGKNKDIAAQIGQQIWKTQGARLKMLGIDKTVQLLYNFDSFRPQIRFRNQISCLIEIKFMHDRVIQQHNDNTQSTHSSAAQASAARLIVQLRHDFSNKNEASPSSDEVERLRTISLSQTLETELNTFEIQPDSNIKGILQFLRFIYAAPERFPKADCNQVLKLIVQLTNFGKDHWTANTYYPNGATEPVIIDSSLGETLNLVCLSIFETTAFTVAENRTPKQDTAERVNSLFQCLMKQREGLCSGGRQHEFLFLLNGTYKNIRLIEDISSFLLDTIYAWLTVMMNKQYPIPKVLYAFLKPWLFDSKTDDEPPYLRWLKEQTDALFSLLIQRCQQFALNPQETKTKIEGVLAYPDLLNVPNDLHPAVRLIQEILAIKVAANSTVPFIQSKQHALQCTQARIQTCKTLDEVYQAYKDFPRALNASRELESYLAISIFIGEENSELRTTRDALQLCLQGYFDTLADGALPSDFDTLYNAFHTEARTFNQTKHIDFISNFFAIADSAFPKAQLATLIPLRQKLVLTDDKLLSWLNKYQTIDGAVALSPYEINRILFHSWLVPPQQWSENFTQALTIVLDWLRKPNTAANANEREVACRKHYPRNLLANLQFILCLKQANFTPVEQQALFALVSLDNCDGLQRCLKSWYDDLLVSMLNKANEQQMMLIWTTVESKPADIIQDNIQLRLLLNCQRLSEDQRMQILNALESRLAEFVQNSDQLRHLLDCYYLSDAQRTQILNAVESRLTDIFQDGVQLRHLLGCPHLQGQALIFLLESSRLQPYQKNMWDLLQSKINNNNNSKNKFLLACLTHLLNDKSLSNPFLRAFCLQNKKFFLNEILTQHHDEATFKKATTLGTPLYEFFVLHHCQTLDEMYQTYQDLPRALNASRELEPYLDISIFIGEEANELRTTRDALQLCLQHYFNTDEVCPLSPNFDALYHAFRIEAQTFDQMKQFDFISNFFVIADGEIPAAQLTTLSSLRQTLILTEDKLLSWVNTYRTMDGAIALSPYEINRIVLHAWLVLPQQWSRGFTQALAIVLDWLKKPSTVDNPNEQETVFCKNYPRELLANLQFILALKQANFTPEQQQTLFALMSLNNNNDLKRCLECWYGSSLLVSRYGSSLLVSILNKANKQQVMLIWDAMKNRVADIIQNGVQLLYLLDCQHLSNDQRTQIWIAVESRLADIIRSGSELSSLLKCPHLNNDQRTLIWSIIEDKLADIIQNGAELCYLLNCKYLSKPQRMQIWTAVESKLADIIRSSSELSRLLDCQYLSNYQRMRIWTAVESKLADIIHSGSALRYFLDYCQYLDDDQRMQIWTAVEIKPTHIISNVSDLHDLFTCYYLQGQALVFLLESSSLQSYQKDMWDLVQSNKMNRNKNKLLSACLTHLLNDKPLSNPFLKAFCLQKKGFFLNELLTQHRDEATLKKATTLGTPLYEFFAPHHSENSFFQEAQLDVIKILHEALSALGENSEAEKGFTL